MIKKLSRARNQTTNWIFDCSALGNSGEGGLFDH
jgi:hypothetical protein